MYIRYNKECLNCFYYYELVTAWFADIFFYIYHRSKIKLIRSEKIKDKADLLVYKYNKRYYDTLRRKLYKATIKMYLYHQLSI